ncbi:hypothetical protein NOR53_3244 [gamma proteobacterium NOR5-3]|nr:hypothetical protein NOR53_3244 [gamma proteobacterium NOR5-3]
MSFTHPTIAGSWFAVFLLIYTGTAAAADDDFPGFEKLMSKQEFADTGLKKLSGDELEALNQWLIRYTAGDAQILQTSSEAVREAEKDFAVESQITGDFSGWSGKTVFRLENGQVWKQRLSGRYPYRGPANPKVVITKNFMGYYKMTLVDVDRSIGVSRVR